MKSRVELRCTFQRAHPTRSGRKRRRLGQNARAQFMWRVADLAVMGIWGTFLNHILLRSSPRRTRFQSIRWEWWTICHFGGSTSTRWTRKSWRSWRWRNSCPWQMTMMSGTILQNFNCQCPRRKNGRLSIRRGYWASLRMRNSPRSRKEGRCIKFCGPSPRLGFLLPRYHMLSFWPSFWCSPSFSNSPQIPSMTNSCGLITASSMRDLP